MAEKKWKTTALSYLALALSYFLHKSYRYRWLNPEKREEALSLSKSGATAISLWHQNCLPGLLAHTAIKLSFLVSKSFDGSLIAFVGERLGLDAIRGSSSKGAAAALRQLTGALKEGRTIGITVDGPRGPLYEPKPGVLLATALSGATILPMASIGQKYWRLKSWDRFRIPKPFSKVYILYGEPLSF